MSFYNADPRAYFEWNDYKAYDATNRTVTKNDDTTVSIDNLEVGRLVRIIDIDSKSSANNNYKIYKVTINNETKILEKFDLTNPYSMAIGENTNANQPNQTVVGKNNAESQNALFIVGNGTVNNDTVTPNNAFEVLDGSENNKGIKVNGDRWYIDSNGIHLGTYTITSTSTQISGTPSYQPASGITESNQKIGEIQLNSQTVNNGAVYLPSTITKDTTFNGNLIIDSSKILTTKKIVSNFTPSEATKTLLTLNENGNTQIGKNDANSIASGLQFGGYPIQIIPYDQWTALVTKDSNTLYIVLPQPSQS